MMNSVIPLGDVLNSDIKRARMLSTFSITSNERKTTNKIKTL